MSVGMLVLATHLGGQAGMSTRFPSARAELQTLFQRLKHNRAEPASKQIVKQVKRPNHNMTRFANVGRANFGFSSGSTQFARRESKIERFAFAPFLVPVPKRARRPAPRPPSLSRLRGQPAITKLVTLASAPFPYDGPVPGRQASFLDVNENGRRGHTNARGQVMWADEVFNDARTLFHIPSGFNARKPGVILLFFHGHGATLARDVRRRQLVPSQVSASGMNAILVAPQFAVDAADSSIGKFWMPGGLSRFLSDAAVTFATLQRDARLESQFARMPVVIVAYSGGFVPAAWAIRAGKLGGRLKGVVLLDGLYGHEDTFATWAKQINSTGFFINAYGHSTRNRSVQLETNLSARAIPITTVLPAKLGQGEVVLSPTPANHRDFVTHAWTESPISDLLKRLSFVGRRPPNAMSRNPVAWETTTHEQ